MSLVSTLFAIHCRYMYHTIVTQLLSVSTLTKVIFNKNVFIPSVSKLETEVKCIHKIWPLNEKNYGVFFKDCKFWYMPKILQFRKTFLGITVNWLIQVRIDQIWPVFKKKKLHKFYSLYNKKKLWKHYIMSWSLWRNDTQLLHHVSTIFYTTIKLMMSLIFKKWITKLLTLP